MIFKWYLVVLIMDINILWVGFCSEIILISFGYDLNIWMWFGYDFIIQLITFQMTLLKSYLITYNHSQGKSVFCKSIMSCLHCKPAWLSLLYGHWFELSQIMSLYRLVIRGDADSLIEQKTFQNGKKTNFCIFYQNIWDWFI